MHVVSIGSKASFLIPSFPKLKIGLFFCPPEKENVKIQDEAEDVQPIGAYAQRAGLLRELDVPRRRGIHRQRPEDPQVEPGDGGDVSAGGAAASRGGLSPNGHALVP